MGFFGNLKTYYTQQPLSKPPTLSANAAAALSVIYVLGFVLPFYLDEKTRPSPTLTRDAPSVIRARLRAVIVTTIATVATTLYVLAKFGKYDLTGSLHQLGLLPAGAGDVARVLSLCMILFAGPLFETLYVDSSWRELLSPAAWRERTNNLIWWRNIILAPLLEEAVFRSAILPLHLLTYLPPSADPALNPNYRPLIFITPLYFGIAHVHHFYEFRVTHQHVPVLFAVLRSVLQMAYTTLFGVFAAFVLLRTGSFWACYTAHAFCNAMGLPRFWGMVTVPETYAVGQGGGELSEQLLDGPGVDGEGEGRKRDDDKRRGTDGGGSSSMEQLYTVVYYLLLVAGSVGFYKMLYPLTESSNALVPV